MKAFLLVFAASCMVMGVARVIGMVWGETSELTFTRNGRVITLHGFWAELATFPLVWASLWLAWTVVSLAFQ